MRLPDAVAKLEEVAEDTGNIGDESANATQRSQNNTDVSQEKRKRRRKRRLSGGHHGKNHRDRRFRGANAPPKHVHCNDWREMLALTANNLVGQFAENSLNKSEGDLLQVDAQQINRSATSLNDRPLSAADETAPYFRMRAPTEGSTVQHQWIEQTFSKRECAVFIASSKDPNKCGCGRARQAHSASALAAYNPLSNRGPDGRKAEASQRWTISRHTVVLPTDAYGTVEFQGGPHPFKAQYLRTNFDTDPADIMCLFDNVWELPKPTLIITVHGGITNFDLQPKLARVFRKGLLKAARTTGAWIITSGMNAGVVRHVSAALEGAISTSKARSKIVSIGIAPWGLLKKREDFLGQDKIVSYHPHSFSPKGRFAVLNNRHSYFLLVDNGTVGRYGADIILRRRLESYIAEKRKIGGCAKSVPVVCVILEGGTCTVRTILDYVTNIPRVPVVICDGSGRASDLIAFAHQWVGEDGNLPDGVRLQLLNLVQNVFQYDTPSAQCLIQDILACVRQKHLVTVFRLGENAKQDVDYAILTALLKGQNLSAPEQLLLALAWNRVDIARSDIFVMGQHWPKSALHNAMMDALIHNRVDFVRLLLENGVSMHDFLTMGRLEELYNTDQGPPNTLYYIVRDVVKIRSGYRYKLPHIGLAIEKLMANGFRSHYTSSEFRRRYTGYRNRRKEMFQRERNKSGRSASEFFSPVGSSMLPVASGVNLHEKDATIVPAISGSRALSNHILWRSAFRRDHPTVITGANLNQTKDAIIDFEDESSTTEEESSKDFKYPFSDLLIWAVMTKRHEMALCMWQHGEEALAKALVACRLYKSLAKEAAEDYLEVEICDELRKYAEEFRELSLELLDHCYRHDDTQTLQLLTYELSYWGKETCLSLAVIVNNKQFLAHPCCQILLADLWHGGLRIRSNSNLKVILGILFPPSIFLLEFKSREELMLQPQTAVEHEDDINDIETSSDGSSSSSSDDSDTDDEASDGSSNLPPGAGLDKRRMSTSSVQSHNLTSIFQNRRTRRRNRTTSRASHTQPADGKDIEMNAKETTDGKHLTANNLSVTRASGGLDPAAAPRKRLRTLSWRQNGPEPSNVNTEEQGYQASSPETTPKRKSTLGRKLNKVDPAINIANGLTKSGLPAIPLPEGITLSRKRQIKFRRKFYEFFAAPITTFWSWSLSFIVFLSALTYVLLVQTPSRPSPLEWILFAYVVAFGLEITRKFFMSEPDKLKEKLEYFMFNYWNALTTMAIVGHVIGFGFRLVPAYSVSYGRIILAVNFVLWSIKLLDFLSVHSRFGPYITMAGKMIMNMAPIVVMLLISLLGFGLARQSITYPDEEWHWLLVRNIFYKPYFMLYGEVYADEIDTCGDEGKACVPGHWVPPLLMTVFLLIANILLISMLIAIFNNIFDLTSKISQQIWLFQRYRQVIEYESTPFLPPPFTPLYHCYMIVRYIRYRLKRRQSDDGKKGNLEKERSPFFDFSLKLFLSDDQVEKLHDFEEECMEEMERAKEFERNRSSEERLHRTAERTDLILVKLNDFASRETLAKGNIRDLENRLEVLEERQSELLDCMRQITTCLPAIIAALPGAQAAPTRPPQPPAGALHVDTSAGQHATDTHSRRLTVSGTPSQYTSSETVVAAPLHVPGRAVPQTAPVLDPSASPPSFPQSSDFASRRMRTTTIAGPDMTPGSSHAPARHRPPVRFGSLLSLDPRMLASPSSKTTGSVRRRRRNDEYTSITDAIDIEEIERMNALGVGTTSGSATVAASTSAPLSEGALYSDDDSRLHPLHESVHTEDDVDDEESDVAEDSVEPIHYEQAIYDDEGLNISREALTSSDELASADTPTTTLRRAKPSFIQRQNTILKDYEEDVGGGNHAASDQSDNDASRDTPPSESEYQAKRRRPTVVEPNEDDESVGPIRRAEHDSDGSKEFIQFLGLSDKHATEQPQHSKFSSASTDEAADDRQSAGGGRFAVTPVPIPPAQAPTSEPDQPHD